MLTRGATTHTSGFDAFAAGYEHALNAGLRYSGEGQSYFIHGRLLALGDWLGRLGERPQVVLDFGCGVGGSTALLKDMLGADRAVGVDISTQSLAIARAASPRADVDFLPVAAPLERAVDCAYCNGVLHHIVPADRARAVEYVFSSLRPGGLFALCENNPWNPGTRLVMRAIPFDRDAVPLSNSAARMLLRAAGFEVLGTVFLFIFPRVVPVLRPLERRLRALPLGAQYMILARRPGDDEDPPTSSRDTSCQA